MTAADFWDASPRAIMALYDCARQARGTHISTDARRAGARGASNAAQPQRLSRLPH